MSDQQTQPSSTPSTDALTGGPTGRSAAGSQAIGSAPGADGEQPAARSDQGAGRQANGAANGTVPSPPRASARGPDGSDSGTAVPEWAGALDDDGKAWLAKAGHKDVAALVKSQRHLETLLGADKAGRGLVLPKDEGDGEAWSALYDKLGRPKDAAGYALDKREGVEPELAQAFGATFHELGLSARQAGGIVDRFMTMQGEAAARAEAAAAQQERGEAAQLRSSLGATYEATVETALRAAGAAGLEEAQLVAIRRAIGPAALVTALAKLGAGVLEDQVPNGAGGAGGGNALTQLEERKKDGAFMERYLNKDKEAVQEMNRLYADAYSNNKQ